MSERVLGRPFVHVRHVMAEGGMQYTTRPATDAEIAGAFREQFHCGNCDHFCRAKADGQEQAFGYCGDFDGEMKYDVEFCSQHSKLPDHHTELTGAPR